MFFLVRGGRLTRGRTVCRNLYRDSAMFLQQNHAALLPSDRDDAVLARHGRAGRGGARVDGVVLTMCNSEEQRRTDGNTPQKTPEPRSQKITAQFQQQTNKQKQSGFSHKTNDRNKVLTRLEQVK